MEMTMQSFLEQQKKMLKEDLASLQEVKSKLIKSNEEVSNELRVLYATKPPFSVPLGSQFRGSQSGDNESFTSKVNELTQLRVKLFKQLAIVRKQIADIELAIENI
jgi:hypothetical protein|nr:MAG TPA: protein of unknown function (DUF5320) [Caudoviricetes sp.]